MSRTELEQPFLLPEALLKLQAVRVEAQQIGRTVNEAAVWACPGGDGQRRGYRHSQFRDGRLERIQLAGSPSPRRGWGRRLQVLGHRGAADVEVTGDLAQGPVTWCRRFRNVMAAP